MFDGPVKWLWGQALVKLPKARPEQCPFGWIQPRVLVEFQFEIPKPARAKTRAKDPQDEDEQEYPHEQIHY